MERHTDTVSHSFKHMWSGFVQEWLCGFIRRGHWAAGGAPSEATGLQGQMRHGRLCLEQLGNTDSALNCNFWSIILPVDLPLTNYMFVIIKPVLLFINVLSVSQEETQDSSLRQHWLCEYILHNIFSLRIIKQTLELKQMDYNVEGATFFQCNGLYFMEIQLDRK